MNIVIAGCGKIGRTVLESLLLEGHNITVIDNDPEVIREITNIYDVMGVCGNATDATVMDDAEVKNAGLFIGVTGSDEMNMLACFIARKLGAHHSIARIRNPEYNENGLEFLRQQLNLSMAVNPDRLAAQELHHTLKVPGAVNIETFSRRNFEMVELRLKPDSVLDGMKLVDIRRKYSAKFLVCIVQRGEEVFIPDGNFELHGGDRIGITAEPAEAQKLLKTLGLMQKKAKDIMIVGASRMAFYLAKLLLNDGNNVKIIERDVERCQQFCELLPKATIINGDAANQELLLEEGLQSMDAFISLTGMDEQNILLAYAAQSSDVQKVITKVNRREFYPMAEKLGLESIVSPRRVVSDVFVKYARALHNSLESSNIETLYKLMDDKAEAIEFLAHSDFKYLNIPLKDLSLRKNLLIAGIIRGRQVIIPVGEDVIQNGDRVVVIAAHHRMKDLADIIA